MLTILLGFKDLDLCKLQKLNSFSQKCFISNLKKNCHNIDQAQWTMDKKLPVSNWLRWKSSWPLQENTRALESIVCMRVNNTRTRAYQYSSDIYQCNSVQLYTLENLIYTSNETATSLVFTKGIALEAHQNVQKMSSIVLAYHGPYTRT